MTGNTDMHLLVTDTFKKRVGGVDQKTSPYLVLTTICIMQSKHLFRIELIRLLIVACGMLSHSFNGCVKLLDIISIF
jgi:hypothetical protein